MNVEGIKVVELIVELLLIPVIVSWIAATITTRSTIKQKHEDLKNDIERMRQEYKQDVQMKKYENHYNHLVEVYEDLITKVGDFLSDTNSDSKYQIAQAAVTKVQLHLEGNLEKKLLQLRSELGEFKGEGTFDEKPLTTVGCQMALQELVNELKEILKEKDLKASE